APGGGRALPRPGPDRGKRRDPAREHCRDRRDGRGFHLRGRADARGLMARHRAGFRSMTIDAAILSALRSADWTSGAELSARLGVTRAAIWARIEELRQLGYQIQASPHSGYRLVACPDRLHADDLVSRLPQARVIGREIRVFQETSST